MARINLLPWREEKRKQVKQQFGILVGLCIAASAGTGMMVNNYFEGQLDQQTERNRYLREQTETLQTSLNEIKDLDATRSKLQTRMELVFNLSGERIKPIKLIHEISSLMPKGAYLTEVDNKDSTLIVKGRTNSHTTISQFISDLEGSEWVRSTYLNEITSEGRNNQRDTEQTAMGATKPSDFKVTLTTQFPQKKAMIVEASAAMRGNDASLTFEGIPSMDMPIEGEYTEAPFLGDLELEGE
ncbi:MAG: PilN domain-containing protein [Gammaproteobacteria bacterium]|nr:PilN domain-containing protein [Gammaproteobacteria bacterium]